MATKQRVSLAQRFKRLQRAEKSKWNKFTWSGLLIILVGLILIFVGISLRTGGSTNWGFAAMGIGGLVVLGGIIRTLIGVINPSSPEELIPYEQQEELESERAREARLETQIFEPEQQPE